MKVVVKTEISAYPLLSRGKVRDIYDVDEKTLLIVTTDRMSAFDVIMNEPIPYKGVILNQITLFWMEKFFVHSDEYTEFRCSCGRPAIVNVAEHIYKCSYCKDAADIFRFPTSYSAKLFRQQQACVGIGARLIPEPYVIEQKVGCDFPIVRCPLVIQRRGCP